MSILRRIIERVDCSTCGAKAGDYCKVISSKKPGLIYHTSAYAHAARKEKFRQLVADTYDECFGKHYVAGNELCDVMCCDSSDCKAICRGEMTYEDRHRLGAHNKPESKGFALVKILSEVLARSGDAGVQVIPGRLRGERCEGSGQSGSTESLPKVSE